jgi:hypothetical protein
MWIDLRLKLPQRRQPRTIPLLVYVFDQILNLPGHLVKPDNDKIEFVMKPFVEPHAEIAVLKSFQHAD